ncbi:MAG: hypothetical protein KDA80_07080 [Planctomycetaceae bacterium]|nr:hypothetical protein [Planctomycetaceae bacterium]
MPPLHSESLRDFIETQGIDLHQMTLEEFREWLRTQIERFSRQPVFQQKCRIRNLIAANLRKLNYREKRLRESELQLTASPTAKAITRKQRELENLQKGVDGLTKAVQEGRADPEKLAEFRKRLQSSEREQQRLIDACPEYQQWQQRTRSWFEFRNEIGLTEAETELERLEKQSGRYSSSAGNSFEKVSSLAVSQFVIPIVGRAGTDCCVLHGVTLGCARGELDQLVVARHPGTDIVDVLAVVEAKRNINDLVHGYRQRLENLHWFADNSAGFDPEQYRTETYPHGRFEGLATHQEHGETFCFSSESFSQFRSTEKEVPLEGLFFVTESRPLNGLTGGELSRVMNRVATDPRFDLNNLASCRRLKKWVLDTMESVQTIDVLRLYDQNGLADRIIFANRETDGISEAKDEISNHCQNRFEFKKGFDSGS